MTLIRRHIVAIAITFVLVFNTAVIVGGNWTIRRETCRSQRAARDDLNEALNTELDAIESVMRGERGQMIIDGIRYKIASRPPIAC